MKTVMVVSTSGLGIGGITTHILNYVSKLCDKYRFIIIDTIFYDENVIEKFKNFGCEVIKLPNRKKHLLLYLLKLQKIIKKEKIDIIHVHGNSATMYFELNIAKKNSVGKRIAHCHNSLCSHVLLHNLLRTKFKKSYTNAVACSNAAGEWIYGKNEFTVLPNVIETSLYKYNNESRKKYRKIFNVDDDTFLLGNVGNLIEQKNQKFLIPVLSELTQKRKCKLVIIGSGVMEKQLKELIEKCQLENYVELFSYRDDISDCLQAFDCLVMPSKWEGLPMVLIEAQTSGLPCVCSDNISKEAAISPDFYTLPLHSETWVSFLSILSKNVDRNHGIDYAKERGFDICQSSDKLESIYSIREG